MLTHIENTGQFLIVSPVADPVSLKRVGVDPTAEQTSVPSRRERQYLEFHRENALRMARGLSRGERRP